MEIRFIIDTAGKGNFILMEGEEQWGEMDFSISDKKITVFHTQIAPQAEGKGLARQLLQAMVDHARKNDLKVIPLCPYVHASFKKNPEQYADIWYHHEEGRVS